jgi:hypothetical protein
MNKKIIFIMSGWIVFAMRIGFSGIMFWGFTDTTTDFLRYTLLGLSAMFFANAVTQIFKMYDFLKKVDTLDLTID